MRCLFPLYLSTVQSSGVDILSPDWQPEFDMCGQLCNQFPDACMGQITLCADTVCYGLYWSRANAFCHINARTPGCTETLPPVMCVTAENLLIDIASPDFDGIALAASFGYRPPTKSKRRRVLDSLMLYFSPPVEEEQQPLVRHQGSSGFINFGNMCYLNSALQLLRYIVLHSPNLMELIDTQANSFLGKLKLVLNDDSPAVNAWLILDYLNGMNPDYFVPGTTEDGYEAFSKLTEYLSKESRAIGETFDLQNIVSIKCMNCQSLVESVGVSQEIHLHLRTDMHEVELEDLLIRHESPEKMQDSKCYRCLQENERIRRFTVTGLPQMLIIALKRFPSEGTDKILTSVKIPLQLDFPIGTVFAVLASYRLRGIMHHMDVTTTGGHYTSDIYHDGKWYNANDDTVSLLSNGPTRQGFTPYVLLYEKMH